MAGLSNLIEDFIKELLKQAEDGIIEIGRNELAEYFECAPSQINYVLTTRFTPYMGYYIESRRGGGGYIKITKVDINKNEDIGNIIIETIGEEITKNKAYKIVENFCDEEIISNREREIIKAAIGDRAMHNIDYKDRNRIRADILKNILLILAK